MSKTKRVYRFKTPPWRHQVRGLKRALREGTFCLNMEQRTGKSKVAIDYIGCQYEWRGADTILILTPKSVIGRWWLEIKHHMPDHIREAVDIRVMSYESVYDRERWEERKIKGEKEPRIYYSSDSNWEGREGKIKARGWEVVPNKELIKWAKRAAKRRRFILILDEAHTVSNASSQIHRKTFALARMTDMVLNLTGTPFHKKPVGVFGQWKMIDINAFGTNRGAFERMFCVYSSDGLKVVRYTNLDIMAERIAPKVYTVREEDCWDIPRSRDEIVPVYMEESREAYEALARESIVELESGHVVDAPLAITLALRLHQLTGGFLRTDEGVVPVGQEKARALDSLVGELKDAGRSKLVVFARFRPEVAACARVAIRRGYRVVLLHGGVPRSQRDYRIACFEEWQEPTIFISQIATGSMGLELSVARDEIFYSLTNSLVHYSQARARIRGHKQRRAMNYWHLLMDGTVDPAILLSLRQNMSLGHMIQAHPEMLRSTFARR